MFKNQNAVGGKKEKQWWLAYFLLLPSFVLFAIFSYYPLIKTVVNSFAVTDQIGRFIKWAGFSNWQRVLGDTNFGSIMWQTLVFAFLNLLLTFLPAMFLALLSTKKQKGAKIYQTLYAMPMVIAAASTAAVWKFMLNTDGLINQWLGLDVSWLGSTSTALTMVAIITSWSHIAGRYIYLMVGFRSVPDDLLEASVIDGAGWWTRMIKIMIPMASPQIFFVLFTSIVSAFKTFTQIKLITNGGPAESTNTLMFWQYQKFILGQISSAACIALVLFIVIFIATRIQFAFEKNMVFYQ